MRNTLLVQESESADLQKIGQGLEEWLQGLKDQKGQLPKEIASLDNMLDYFIKENLTDSRKIKDYPLYISKIGIFLKKLSEFDFIKHELMQPAASFVKWVSDLLGKYDALPIEMIIQCVFALSAQIKYINRASTKESRFLDFLNLHNQSLVASCREGVCLSLELPELSGYVSIFNHMVSKNLVGHWLELGMVASERVQLPLLNFVDNYQKFIEKTVKKSDLPLIMECNSLASIFYILAKLPIDFAGRRAKISVTLIEKLNQYADMDFKQYNQCELIHSMDLIEKMGLCLLVEDKNCLDADEKKPLNDVLNKVIKNVIHHITLLKELNQHHVKIFFGVCDNLLKLSDSSLIKQLREKIAEKAKDKEIKQVSQQQQKKKPTEKKVELGAAISVAPKETLEDRQPTRTSAASGKKNKKSKKKNKTGAVSKVDDAIEDTTQKSKINETENKETDQKKPPEKALAKEIKKSEPPVNLSNTTLPQQATQTRPSTQIPVASYQHSGRAPDALRMSEQTLLAEIHFLKSEIYDQQSMINKQQKTIEVKNETIIVQRKTIDKQQNTICRYRKAQQELQLQERKPPSSPPVTEPAERPVFPADLASDQQNDHATDGVVSPELHSQNRYVLMPGPTVFVPYSSVLLVPVVGTPQSQTPPGQSH